MSAGTSREAVPAARSARLKQTIHVKKQQEACLRMIVFSGIVSSPLLSPRMIGSM